MCLGLSTIGIPSNPLPALTSNPLSWPPPPPTNLWWDLFAKNHFYLKAHKSMYHCLILLHRPLCNTFIHNEDEKINDYFCHGLVDVFSLLLCTKASEYIQILCRKWAALVQASAWHHWLGPSFTIRYNTLFQYCNLNFSSVCILLAAIWATTS